MLVLIIPFGAWFTICSQQISQNLMNKHIPKKDMETICMVNMYIYLYIPNMSFHLEHLQKTNPKQIRKPPTVKPTFSPPGPQKKTVEIYGGKNFSKKLLRGFKVGIGNSSSSTTISTLHHQHPMTTTKLGAGFFELFFFSERFFSKPKEAQQQEEDANVDDDLFRVYDFLHIQCKIV